MSTNRPSFIQPGHVRAFQAVTSQMYDASLMSCWINGEPGVAIVLIENVGEGKMAVMPLFVAITASMEVDFGDDRVSGSGGEGGPKRSAPAKDFEAGKSMLVPGGAQ